MTNCATEEIGQQNGTQSSIEAKDWFDTHKDNYNTTILKYVKDLQWENAIVSDGDIGEVVEVPFTLEDYLSVSNKNADLYNDHHRLMFIKGEDNEFKLFYVQIFTTDKESKIIDKNYNYYNIKDNFDGKVFVQELTTNIVSKLDFENGNKIKPSLTSKQREAYIDCVAIGYWYEDGHFEPIGILYCEGGGGDSGEPSPSGGYGGGGGTSGSGSGSGTTGVTSFQKIEKNINSDKLDACSKAILDKLKNLTQGDLAKIMSKLGGDSTVYTLTFDIGNTNGNLAATTRNSLNSYVTVLDKDFLDGNDGTGINKPPTDLAIAAVIIHEVVHAYFFSLFDDKVNSNMPKALDNFDLLYQRYVTKTYVGTDDAQHAQIWKSFIDTMSSSLQEYNTGIPTNSPSQFYKDIIMGTLMTTNAFGTNYPSGSTDYKRILNTYLSEKNNGSNDPAYAPKGKPCK